MHHLASEDVVKRNAWRAMDPKVKSDLIKINFSAADLSGAILSGIDLARADLARVNLSGAK